MRATLALVLLFVSSLAAAEPSPPRQLSPDHTPYTLRLDVDLPLLVLGGALWGGTAALSGSDAPPPWCGSSTTPPCDANGVNKLDHFAIGYDSDTARIGANVVAGVLPSAFALLDVFDAGITHWRAWMVDGVVVGEAVLWTGAIQDIVRRAVRRPRPFMYAPGLGGGARDSAESTFSFFSGHTSNTFAMVTAVAFTYSLRHPHSKWQWLVWSLGLAAASVEPVLRVGAGDHFPTDCIVGAAVGVASGVLFPAVHRARLPLRLSASSGKEGAALAISGRF